MASNYYEILEVSKNSDANAIRTAYRAKVKDYHPDVSDFADAEKRFKQLKSAYEVLNHRKNRRRYDEMGHDEYVDQYGGYTSEELEITTEVQLRRRNDGGEQSSGKSDFEEFFETKEPDHSSAETGPLQEDGKLSWLIQGRTGESDGTFSYVLRLMIYASLVFVSVSFVEWVSVSNVSVLNRPSLFLSILLTTRIGYLAGFDYLRQKYVKIDEQPEPDAYTIPYALAIGGIGFTFTTGFYLAVTEGVVQAEAPRVIIGGGFLLSIALLIFGYVGLILSIGWGTADDCYNLKYDVEPAVWNFAVQTPLLILLSGVWQNFTFFLQLMIGLAPLVVGALYLTIYHREILTELNWRMKNRTVYPT